MLKRYINRLYRIEITEEEEILLLEYLSKHHEKIVNLSSLQDYILLFLKKSYDVSSTLSHSNDNSDLEQMLKLIKVKAKKNNLRKSE